MSRAHKEQVAFVIAMVLSGMMVALSGCAGEIGMDDTLDTSTWAARGVPSGAHYNLNIIGVKTNGGPGSSGGHVIHVPLTGSTRINLAEGDFQVLDSNGLDGTAAFQLPNPDPTNSGQTTYSVFARALGKPGGSSSTTTCATEVATGELYCSIYSMVLVRSKGGSTFTNVSKQLLYVYADTDGDGTAERYPLFSDALADYFWQYDNSGLKLAQLRFYQVSTNVN